jgi:hypothetical protein
MTAANLADPLGYDASVGIDLGPTGASCSGLDLVSNALLHRFMEDNLPMLGAPGGFIAFGKNIRRLVGQVTTQSRAEQLGPELAAVVNRDPRINPGLTSVALTVQPAGARYNLTIAVNATTTTALPISLVYGITAATVERLAAGT